MPLARKVNGNASTDGKGNGVAVVSGLQRVQCSTVKSARSLVDAIAQFSPLDGKDTLCRCLRRFGKV